MIGLTITLIAVAVLLNKLNTQGSGIESCKLSSDCH